MSKSSSFLAVIACAALAGGTFSVAGGSPASAQAPSCAAALTLSDLKLADEIERSTIYAYLTGQELAGVKRQLAAALAKCGAACATP